MAAAPTEAVLGKLGAKSASVWAPILTEACARHGITSKRRVAAFLANILHETGKLGTLIESLNYRADKLVEVFGAHRIDAATAQQIGRVEQGGNVVRAAEQEAIANTVYGGAWGRANLGNTEPGDGWRFRGRGLIQLTGRANYSRFAGKIGKSLDQLPAVLESRDGAAESAAHFFEVSGCNALADAEDIAGVRLKINGGDKGLHEVKDLYGKALAALA